MRNPKQLFAEYKSGDAKVRSHMTSKCSMIANFSTAIGKMIIGLVTMSVFFIISAVYSIGIGATKQVYFKGVAESNGEKNKEIKYYFRIAALLLVTSLVYIAYMIRLFFVHSTYRYGSILGISIAAISFFDLGLAVHGLIKSNKLKDLLLSGLKIVSLCSALITLVLTQTALLSFTHEATESAMIANAQSNAVLGVVMGGISCLLALMMCIKGVMERKKAEI